VNWLLLGHTEDMAEYARHRGLMETEAESVAYVVAGIVGFDTSAYSVGYIAGWADGDTDLIKSTAARVLRIAHQVATILARDENEDEAADENDAASGPS
jgi:5-formyltetrahydrofolate cyclo-ligase